MNFSEDRKQLKLNVMAVIFQQTGDLVGHTYKMPNLTFFLNIRFSFKKASMQHFKKKILMANSCVHWK